MTIRNGTLLATGATIIIKDDNEKPYTYTKWYRIDINENGQWKELDPIDKDHISDELGEYQALEFKLDWTDLYGNLKKGKYRLVKSIYDNEDRYFSVEFSID